MEFFYIIITIALFSITYKIVKAIDNSGNKEQNNENNQITIKDGMNLYFGKILGKIIIIIIGILIALIIPIFLIK